MSADNTDAQNTVDLLQMLHSGIGDLTVNIQNGIGVLTLTAVHHVGNVDILRGDGGGEPAQQIGDIAVQNVIECGKIRLLFTILPFSR